MWAEKEIMDHDWTWRWLVWTGEVNAGLDGSGDQFRSGDRGRLSPSMLWILHSTCSGLGGSLESGLKNNDGGRSDERCVTAAAIVVVTAVVASWQVGCSHEREPVVGATVLNQRFHAFLTDRLTGIRHRTVTMDIPRRHIDPVLRRERGNS